MWPQSDKISGQEERSGKYQPKATVRNEKDEPGLKDGRRRQLPLPGVRYKYREEPGTFARHGLSSLRSCHASVQRTARSPRYGAPPACKPCACAREAGPKAPGGEAEGEARPGT
eukprot:gene14727-biopygen5370